MSESTGYEGWAVLELMGHRKLAGKVSEATVGGAALLRLDIYQEADTDPCQTQFYSAAAIYCITPASEEVCRRCARKPTPVAQYEMRALPGRVADEGDDDDDEESLYSRAYNETS